MTQDKLVDHWAKGAAEAWKTVKLLMSGKRYDHALFFVHLTIEKIPKIIMMPVLNIAQEYIDRVKKSGIPVTEAYLFGSFAKKTNHKWSDIDICVISPKFGQDYFDETVKLAYLTHAVDDRIEPVAYAPGDLEDRYSTLAHEIKTYGIPLM